MPIIEQADLALRIGALTTSQAARADALIADAEALIVGETGQQIVQVLADEAVLIASGGQIRLPQRPVTAVASVAAVGCAGEPDTLLDPSEWCWNQLDAIELIGRWHSVGTYRVIYDHGWVDTPAWIKAIVASMVNRVLTSPTLAEGLTGENVGQYGYQMAQQFGSAGSSVRLFKGDRDLLRRRLRRTAATTRTPIN